MRGFLYPYLLSLTSLQAGVEWAASNRKTKEAIGEKCLRCLRVTKAGFPTMDWTEVISEMKSSPSFQEEVQSAIETFEGKPKKFREECFRDVSQAGYRLEQSAWFYSELDIEKKWSVKLKELSAHGCPVRTVIDENGDELSGVIVSDDTPRKIVFYQNINTMYAEEVHNPTTALRAHQGRALATKYRAEVKKQRPAPKDAMASEDLLKEAAESIRTAKLAAQERERLEAAGVEPEPPQEPMGALQAGAVPGLACRK